MAAGKITKRMVDAAPTPEKNDAFIWDSELRGFGLRVTPKGVKSYVIQYRMKGQPARRSTIGMHGSPWTADKAREEAQRLLIMVKQGVDPVAAEREARREADRLAFGPYADKFVELYLKPNWKRSWREGKRILEVNIKPVFEKRALNAIKRADIAELIEDLSDRPATAKNTFAVLRKLFRWAVNRGDLPSSPIAEMEAPKGAPARQRFLDNDELLAAWRAASDMAYPFGPLFRLMIATLQREDEVSGLVGSEIDLAGAIWQLPGGRSKNKEGHRVPLNELAATELEALKPKRGKLVFTTTGKTPVSGFSKAKKRLDAKMLEELQKLATERGDDPASVELTPWKLHDLRRTGTTAMQSLGVPVEVTEEILSHLSGTRAGVAGVYNLFKYDREKRQALDAWGGYLERLIAGADAPNVIALAERRA